MVLHVIDATCRVLGVEAVLFWENRDLLVETCWGDLRRMRRLYRVDAAAHGGTAVPADVDSRSGVSSTLTV